MPNPNSLAPKVSEISVFIQLDGQTDMARSTRLVILNQNIFTLYILSDASNIPLLILPLLLYK